MRLREDKSSYRAGGLLKKEFKHTPLADVAIPHKSKKDRKKWCKGVEGRKHEWEVKTPQSTPFRGIRMPVCKNCGRHDSSKMEFQCHKCGKWKTDLFHKCEEPKTE